LPDRAGRSRGDGEQEHDSIRDPLAFQATASGWARRGDDPRMKEAEMAAIADMISEVLMDIKNVETLAKVRQRVRELTARFPLPYETRTSTFVRKQSLLLG